MNSVKKVVLIFLISVILLSGCLPASSDWTRRDMPTDGLEAVVTYNLQGTAGTENEKNKAMLRGVNEQAPMLMQETVFDRMSGSKTQDVQVTLPNGNVYQALGMVKTERFAGLSNYLSLESATLSGVDFSGKAVCGAKIRLEFNRNLVQYRDPNQRDYDSLWYYTIPCKKIGDLFLLEIENAVSRAVIINEVWQARIAAGSFFFNWGHSVTIVGGPAAALPGGWWTNWDLPDTAFDTMGAAKIANEMVLNLESSHQPWLEFATDSNYSSAHLIYSAGDADQYLNFDRILLNRQQEYAVFYRPTADSSWDYLLVEPVYNFEWNDVQQNIAALKGWSLSNFSRHLTPQGLPKDINDPVIKELERSGWMNAPNASLEQIRIKDKQDKILYTMTVRAFIGAYDTLVMFGRAAPPRFAEAAMNVPASGEDLPRPLVYDENGNPLPEALQDYTSEQWANWQREATMWNFWRDNPMAVSSDLQVQFRFEDNTVWTEIHCTDSDGDKYVCGYRPVEWNLSTSYYFDDTDEDVYHAWLVMQLLGEVGVRTLGMSYASGLYQGTGMLFAMAQIVHRNEFFDGYRPESIWTFDARASQLPDRLSEAWSFLHQQ